MSVTRNRRWIALPALLAVVLAGVVAGTRTAGAGQSDNHYSAVLRRTMYGIPHVLADDFGGLGYGYGYAFAQDNLCVLADQVLTVSGERSRYFDSRAIDPSTGMTSIDSDVFYSARNQSHTVEKLLSGRGPSADARALVAGYAAGFNRYLRATGADGLPDPRCRGEAWVRPITTADLWRVVYDVNTLRDAIFPDQISTAAPGSKAPVVSPNAAPRASNGIGLGRAATKSGNAMLLANPHFSWQGAGRFYQVQLTIPGRLNVSGGSIYGSPVVEIGHNRSLAWTHTISSHSQQSTYFQLKLDPSDPTRYLVDGRSEPMSRQHVTVRTRDGRVERTLYRSRWGRMIVADGMPWNSRTAFSTRGTNAENLRSIDQWLAMGRARTVEQLRAAQSRYQGIPYFTTEAADSRGRTMYIDSASVPAVSDARADRCVSTPEGKALYPQVVILDGSRSGCGWGHDPTALEPGTFGPARHPSLIRTDYVTHSNDTDWLVNTNSPLVGYPQVFGSYGQQRSLRDRLAHDMIAGRRAGTDGYGAPGFDLDSLRATALSDRDYGSELFKDDAVRFCSTAGSLQDSTGQAVDISAACGVLARWNGRADVGSRGAPLWNDIAWRMAGHPDVYRVPFDPDHPLSTPNTLNTAGAAFRHAFADTVGFYQRHDIPLDVTTGAAQQFPGRIPIHGCAGDDECFNYVGTVGHTVQADGTFGGITYGSSFIMAIELTPDGPRTRTILTYSESSNPRSPHFADQTRLYSQKKWIADRFTERQIANDPALNITRL